MSRGAEAGAASRQAHEYVVEAYGEALLDVARAGTEEWSCSMPISRRIAESRRFELTLPDRFIQNGIAEQDMVSMAGGLARHGLLPVVNSFASFLASRANEQIYNNASRSAPESSTCCHYAG